jgi:D-alanyl-D-alanine carboxypeptidase/D-alanyl-D-alanine-endopeptidase (penicillin-binding protein 4)
VVSPLLVLAAVILLPALALFGLWRVADGRDSGDTGESLPPTTVAGAGAAAPPVLDTPLLSFRRVPGLIARDLNDDEFGAAVNSFASTLDPTSCVVVQLDGVEVGARNPDLPVIPASNQKLLVAAAALDVLGADHAFTTEVRAAGVDGGVVPGDLYLVGGGDPLLTSAEYPVAEFDDYPVTDPTSLDALADAVAAAGITQVRGSVVGDGSRYDDEFYNPNWVEDIRGIEVGPVDSLLVNDARVLGDELRSDDPNVGAAREFRRLLEARGITVAGDSGSGTAPADSTVVASVSSAPLAAVISEMMATSDNNTAEMLVKELGVARGAGGTTDAGAQVVLQALAGRGIDTTGVVVDDGSGLSNENRVTCRALVAVLEQHQPEDAFAAGLPVAAESGTLDQIFVDSPVAGRLVAKTGTLSNPPFDADPPAVKALSGYLPVDGGGTIEFALVLNSTGTLADQSVYRPIWDAFAEVLAAYPSGPSAAELGPG